LPIIKPCNSITKSNSANIEFFSKIFTGTTCFTLHLYADKAAQ
jgi:hypothetical protein